jgi:hypothetical protein
VLIAGLVALIVVVAAALAQSTPSSDPPAGAVAASLRGNFDQGRAAAFEGYRLFSPGASFAGIPLAAVTRRRDKPNPLLPATARPRGANWVNFVYASGCYYDDFGIACKDMAQVQVWPACERNLSVYERARRDGDVRLEMMTIRGVPAAFFEDDTMLEIYTADATVVLFARSTEQLRQLADELGSVNASALGAPSVARTQELPPPAEGALAGGLACAPKV